MKERMPIGFMLKQINNVYEKDFNNRLKTLGITASQCAVLDYLFHTREEEVNQKDIEKALSLQNPTVTGLLKRLDEKGYILSVPSNKDECDILIMQMIIKIKKIKEPRRYHASRGCFLHAV